MPPRNGLAVTRGTASGSGRSPGRFQFQRQVVGERPQLGQRREGVGSFSGVPAEDAISQAIFTDATGTNAKLRLLWIGCGKEDFLLKRNEDYTAMLKENGINHQWHLTEGGHSWPVWREYLTEFLPLLFQAPKN